MTELRVLFWDVRNGGDRKLSLIERIDADVVLLLAVSRTSARSWSQRWQGRYHCAAALDTVETPQKRPHGAMIASRWPRYGRHARLPSWNVPNAASSR